jgi:tryptophan-rich sensory protein
VIANAAFAVGAMLLGFLPAALTFTLRKNAANEIGLSELSVPAWVFIAVWAVIYPCMGIAASLVVDSEIRDAVHILVPAIVLAAGFLQTTAFWFTDSLRSTAVTDATGVVLSITAIVVLCATVPSAAPWLLPWLLWMPVTLAVKIVALRRRTNASMFGGVHGGKV